jgi:hypothetical protein
VDALPCRERPVTVLPSWGRSPGREGPLLHPPCLIDIHTVILAPEPGKSNG